MTSSPERTIEVISPCSSTSTALRQAICRESPLRVITEVSSEEPGGSTPETSRWKAIRARSRSAPGTTMSNQSRPMSSASEKPSIAQPWALTSSTMPRASMTTTSALATSRKRLARSRSSRRRRPAACVSVTSLRVQTTPLEPPWGRSIGRADAVIHRSGTPSDGGRRSRQRASCPVRSARMTGLSATLSSRPSSSW